MRRKPNSSGIKKAFKALLYIEETGKLHWSKIISVSLITIALVMYTLYSTKRRTELSREREANARYTIGVTTGRHKNHRLPNPTVDYYYLVDGRKYSKYQFYPIELDIITDGGKYYVEFSIKDPSNAKLLLEKPVPDNQEASPAKGWKVIPNIR